MQGYGGLNGGTKASKLEEQETKSDQAEMRN